MLSTILETKQENKRSTPRTRSLRACPPSRPPEVPSMSQPAVVVPFETDPALVLIRTDGPALYVGAPVAPGWAAWAARLDAVLAASCRSLAGRHCQARPRTAT